VSGKTSIEWTPNAARILRRLDRSCAVSDDFVEVWDTGIDRLCDFKTARRLIAAGLVETTSHDSGEVFYRITEQGRAVLGEWAEIPQVREGATQ